MRSEGLKLSLMYSDAVGARSFWIVSFSSSKFLLPLVYCAEFVFVRVGVISMDFEHLRNKTPAGSPFELHYNVERIADIALDRPIREFNPALEDATRKPSETLLGRRCMDGRETARVTCIEKLQEIERLAAAYLTKNDPVRAVAEGCLQQVADAHSRQAVLWLPRLETNEIVLTPSEFRTCLRLEEFSRPGE